MAGDLFIRERKKLFTSTPLVVPITTSFSGDVAYQRANSFQRERKRADCEESKLRAGEKKRGVRSTQNPATSHSVHT